MKLTPASYLRRVEQAKKAVIVCHRHADIDAYCSAYSLSRLFLRLNAFLQLVVAAPGGLSAPAQRLTRVFPIGLTEESPPKGDFDLAVAVDVGHTALLKEWKAVFERPTMFRILVDHHPLNPELASLFDKLLVDPSASSSAEMVYRLYRARKLRPLPKAASALVAGIMADTQHLTGASSTAIQAVAQLCRWGAKVEEVRRLMASPRDPSEVMARLKAAQRMRIQRAGKWVIACATVGAYQASAARALISLGADVAIVLGEEKGITKGSIRATMAFFEATNVHLGTDIALRAAALLKEASGGGHPTAASINAAEPPERVASTLISLVQNDVEKLHNKGQPSPRI